MLNKRGAGGMVEHHGEHFDSPRLQLSPGPATPPRIYVGGKSEVALRRTAKLGSGYIGAGSAPEEVKPLLETLSRMRCEEGRDNEPFEAMLGISAMPDVGLYRNLCEDGLESTVAPPFFYALGKKQATLDEKKTYLEGYAESVIRHFG